MNETAKRQTCAYCGARNAGVAMHSGILECNKCWYYRKMDHPAASHWAKVGAEFLSNVDMYDITEYLAKCGLENDEVGTMLTAARKVERYSRFLVEHGPEHRWTDEVKAEYENGGGGK